MKFSKLMAIITISACLVGCADKQKKEEQNKISDVSQKIIDDISSIGDVELSDKELIEKIEKNYLNCTEEQKNQINNYATLLEARDLLDDLIKDDEEKKKQEEIAEKERLEIQKQALYTDDVKYCVSALVTIHHTLKNPNSMIVNDICLARTSEEQMVYADISAENSYGGITRSCYIVTHNKDYVGMGNTNLETLMTCFDGEEVGVDSELVSMGNSVDGVDFDIIMQLFDEFLETKDYSMIKYDYASLVV